MSAGNTDVIIVVALTVTIVFGCLIVKMYDVYQEVRKINQLFNQLVSKNVESSKA